MEQNRRSANQTRLHVEMLELRCQPGSLLVDAEATTLPSPQLELDDDSLGFPAVTRQHRERPIAPRENNTGIEVSDQLTVGSSNRFEPTIESQVSVLGTPEHDGFMAPVFHPRMAAAPTPAAKDTGANRSTRPEMKRVTPNVQAVQGTVHDATLGSLRITPFDTARLTTFRIDELAVKSAVWQSYTDFGSASARTNAVAAGRGGNANETFIGGSMGNDGVVVNLDDNGPELFRFIDNGATQVTVTDIATNAANLIVAGNDSPTTAFVLLLNPFTLQIVKGFNYSVLGGSIQLEGAANGLNASSPDIFFTGTINDPLLPPFENIFVTRWDPTLTTPIYASAVNFGDDSHGFAIAADRPENAYVGGNYERAGAVESVLFRLNANGSTMQWAKYIFLDTPSYGNPANGNYGMTFLGGSSAAGGLYTVGNIQADSLHPPASGPFQNTIISKWDETGSGTLQYASAWYVSGADNTGTDGAVDRDGNLYKSGSTGDSSDRDAWVDKFDATGQVVLANDFVGAAGTQETGNAVDLYVNSATANVAFAGNANGTLTHYTPTLPDATYNGGNDGFVAKLTQPLSP